MNGLEVKKMRTELGFTQEELGKMIGVSRNTIINYERGGEIPIAKRALLQKVLAQNAQNTTSVNESSVTYETSYDHKIAENEEKIQKIKKEIEDVEEKAKLNPERKEKYERYISELEERIILHSKIINTILEAKDDFLNK